MGSKDAKQAVENLRFFADTVIFPEARYNTGDDQPAPRVSVDYFIIISGGGCPVDLPINATNVFIISRDNICYDFGGWTLALRTLLPSAAAPPHQSDPETRTSSKVRFGRKPSRAPTTAPYRYYLFINSSVRGPFVPLYVPPSVHWSELLTSLIDSSPSPVPSSAPDTHQQVAGPAPSPHRTSRARRAGVAARFGSIAPSHRIAPTDDIAGPVKLVGTTISCSFRPPPRDPTFHDPNPHIQSMAFATDAVGLRAVLTAPPDVATTFNCGMDVGASRDDVAARKRYIDDNELGLSRAILTAGYQIRGLMALYRDHDGWALGDACNGPHGSRQAVVRGGAHVPRPSKGSDAGEVEDEDDGKDGPGPGGKAAGSVGTAWSQDPYYEKAVNGTTLHPYEVLFFKTNRDLPDAQSHLPLLTLHHNPRPRSLVSSGRYARMLISTIRWNYADKHFVQDTSGLLIRN